MAVLSIPSNAGLADESAVRNQASGIVSLEALWQRHARHVYTLALRLVAEVNAAEGITAEVFQRAFQGVPASPNEERNFLITLTIDRSLAWLRQQQRLLDPVPPVPAPASATGAQPSYPTDLETRLLQLPDYWRVVFVLRDVMGLRHEEIAAYLRTGEAHIRQVVHRARLALRNSLHEPKGDA